MPFLGIGLSHHTAPVTLRERVAFAEARVPATLLQMRNSGLVDEALILSTCNRVEIYASTTLEAREAFPALRDFLISCQEYQDPLKRCSTLWGSLRV